MEGFAEGESEGVTLETYHYKLEDFVERYDLGGADKFKTIMAALPPVGQDGPWLCGGALRRLLRGDALDSDWDFFFKDRAQFEAFDAAIRKVPKHTVITSEHANTYGVPVKDQGKPVKVQAVKIAYYQTLADVLDSFDFSICQFGYDGAELQCAPFALFDLARSRLAVHKITFATASVRRMLKYQTQGYTVCAGAIRALLEAVSKDPALIQSEVTYVD